MEAPVFGESTSNPFCVAEIQSALPNGLVAQVWLGFPAVTTARPTTIAG